MQKLKDEIRNLSAQLANFDFSYRDPVKNFDRSKVKGVVAKLIKVKDSSTMTALEVRIHDNSVFHFIAEKIFVNLLFTILLIFRLLLVESYLMLLWTQKILESKYFRMVLLKEE